MLTSPCYVFALGGCLGAREVEDGDLEAILVFFTLEICLGDVFCWIEAI
jgi:hypothetical protein